MTNICHIFVGRSIGVPGFWLLILVVLGFGAPSVHAQVNRYPDEATASPASTPSTPSNPRQATDLDLTEPLTWVDQSMRAFPGLDNGLSSGLGILILLTVLALVPSIIILCTSFTRIVIVLALVRQAMGTQGLPPSQVITGLAMFLTFLVMAPTFDRINKQAIIPMNNEQITELQAWGIAKYEMKLFMLAQIDRTDNWGDVYMIMNYRRQDTSDFEHLKPVDLDMVTVIPAFILSELKTAFLMGFRIYLPFLVIDMVIASVLISMGMMMLPPVLISLPFKLLLFVLVDGWQLIVAHLLDSFQNVNFPVT